MDYVDVIFAHRADPNVPMLEVVRAFNWVIEQGKAFYWATSEWSPEQIEEAHRTYFPSCCAPIICADKAWALTSTLILNTAPERNRNRGEVQLACSGEFE